LTKVLGVKVLISRKTAVLWAAGAVLLLTGKAWAYIDPGTGGYVYSMVAPLLAVAGAALAFVFRPVRALVGRLFGFLRPGASRQKNQTNDEDM
jgi:hypothetical protein